jgi:hypothetical protein
MPDICTPFPRDRLAIVAVEAEHCPLVLGRILACFAPQGVTAFTIRVHRADRVQMIELEIDGAGERVRSIVHQMRRLPMVRRAHAVGFGKHHRAGLPVRAKI